MNKIKLIEDAFTPSTRSLFIDCNGRLVKKRVESVYSGQHGCACGCRGNHTHYTKNKKTITLIVNKILSQARVQDLDWDSSEDPSFVHVTTNSRYYIAYFEEEP
jgi:hypothetical protein